MNKSFFKSYFTNDFPFFMAMPAVAWQFLFFYIPIVLIFLLSFVNSSMVPTLSNYEYFLKTNFFLVIVRSLGLAFVTSILCLIAAYPVAYCIAFKIKHLKNLCLFFLILPFWTSLMVQVYSWFFVLEHNGLLNSILLKAGLIGAPIQLLNTNFAIYIVMTYCYLPFMIMPLYTILEKIDRRLFEAAADLGATQWQTFTQITIPLSMPGIRTGFFLVFVPSFGEFVVPTLLGGGKKLFVGSLITQYFLFARNPYYGSAFTILSGCVLLCAVILLYLYFSKQTRITTSRRA